jgi:hypothetical protein
MEIMKELANDNEETLALMMNIISVDDSTPKKSTKKKDCNLEKKRLSIGVENSMPSFCFMIIEVITLFIKGFF